MDGNTDTPSTVKQRNTHTMLVLLVYKIIKERVLTKCFVNPNILLHFQTAQSIWELELNFKSTEHFSTICFWWVKEKVPECSFSRNGLFYTYRNLRIGYSYYTIYEYSRNHFGNLQSLELMFRKFLDRLQIPKNRKTVCGF